jgi:branched-chain amino acid transport system substrate-binding protein
VLYGTDASNYTAEINKIAAAKPDALALISFEEATKILPGLISKGIGPQDIQLYTVDGDTADYSDEFDPGTLKGTKGTIPVSPNVADSFYNKLKKIDSSLKDFTYGAQVYDATIMAALAATAANDDSGEAIAAKMTEISRDGTKCTSYADCVKLLEQGEDIDYDGASGPVDLNSNGSPDKATIGIQLYGNDNTYKQVKTVTGVIQ